MALEVKWYDFVCFGIVGVAFIGALWILWMQEGSSRRDFKNMYESLLVARPEHEVVVNALPRGHVSTSQLWTSCWRGLHPLWLLATRFLSFLLMAFFLSWDLVEYDSTIFVYYTEYVICFFFDPSFFFFFSSATTFMNLEIFHFGKYGTDK